MRASVRMLGLAAVGLLCAGRLSAKTPRGALAEALRGTGAAAMLVEVRSGRVLERYGPVAAVAAPGSVLKPLVLHAALAAGAVPAGTTVECTGTLAIRGRDGVRHNLACVHPRGIHGMDAPRALAESCNTYFATLAERMPARVLVDGLRGYGVRVAGGGEAMAPEDRALLALGVVGVRVSVEELAEAYRRLAVQMQGGDAAAAVVRAGLVESVETGMARAARVPGVVVAGKTGTMHDARDVRGHGWFAGVVSGADGDVVLVVCLPGGNGNDAAALAGQVIAARRGR